MTLPPPASGALEATGNREAGPAGVVIADASPLGVLAFEGGDATTFLQGQLSNDVQALLPGSGQWTSYNSPKGRLLATLFLWRAEGAEPRYRAIVAADVAESLRKRLAMFVLRAKVSIADQTGTHRLFGLGGQGAADAARAVFGAVPASGEALVVGEITILHWPDGRLVVVAPEHLAASTTALLSGAAPVGDRSRWDWLTVRAGVPMIGAATQDRFVPQTANWDLIGGLNFRKGCYTGQEIVARTQHLGRLKERLFAFASDADPPPPGSSLYSATFGDQACGTVVNSGSDATGAARFLAVTQIEAAEAGPLAIGATTGPIATRVALPYAIPAPAAPRGRVGA